ncbi:MAG: helix-turn-helix transcriptional regulator [Bauldia sp.]|nr:helix-turn-helix transcriptional regulator [Bauldia sp.]
MPDDVLNALSLSFGEATVAGDWQGWLASMSVAFHASKVGLAPLVERPRFRAAAGSFGYTDVEQEIYESNFSDNDIIWQRMLSQPSGRAYRLQDVIDPDDYERSTVYQEFYRPSGASQIISVPIFVEDGVRFIIACMRPSEDTPFSDAELWGLQRISAYVGQVLRVSRAAFVQREYSGFSSYAINGIRLPLFVLDRSRKVLVANEAGKELLRNSDLVGTSEHGEIRYAERTQDPALQEALDNPSPMSPRLVRLTKEDHPTHAVAVVVGVEDSKGLEALIGATQPAAILFVVRVSSAKSAAPTEFQDHLRDAFQLTMRESAVAALLAGGLGIDDIAVRLGIGQAGVRFHLQRLFWKTDTHNQRDLMRAIGAILGPLQTLLPHGD